MKTQPPNLLKSIALTGLVLLVLVCSCRVAQAQANISGYAVSLDGSSGYLSLPAGTWFSGDFTIEAWVYARSYNNWSRLLDFSDGPDNYNVYLALSGGTSGYPTMGVFTNNNGTPILQAGSQLPLNQWTHLAATLSGSSGTIYINGRPVGAGTLNIPPAVLRTNIYIGRSAYSADSYANAIFDEIRLWNIARTQSQIQQNMNHYLTGLETGLVGYWQCDTGAGSYTLDQTRGHNTATLMGGATWTNSGALLTEPDNYALMVTNQAVIIPHLAAQNAYPLTVMCWFSPQTVNGAMVNKYVSASLNGWQLAYGSQVHAWYYRDGSDFIGNTGGGAVDNWWHHAAFVVDAGGGHLYVDGTLKSTTAWTGTPGPSTTTIPLSLGIYQGDSFFTGGIDEVSVWNTNLTAAQVQHYMTNALQGTEAGLVAYYRLDEGIGTNVFDYTTNLNTGTLSPAPGTWVIPPERAYAPPTVTVLPDPATYYGSSRTFRASVNPNGFPTFLWFVQGQGTSTTNLVSYVGSDYNPVALSATMTNLSEIQFYHCSFIASNVAGVVQTPTINFQAPGYFSPWIAYLNTNVNGLNATVTADVNPNAAATTVNFVYGTTTNYGTTNAIGYVGSGTSVSSLSQTLSNLTPQTTYHFAFIASNLSGTNSGGDGAFQITGAPPVLSDVVANSSFGVAGVRGAVNPNGAATAVWVAYGNSTSYGATNLVTVLPSGIPVPVPFAAAISNLTLQSTFHYTVIASNMLGISSVSDSTFQTAYLLGATSLFEGPQAGVDSVLLGGVPAGVAWTAVPTVPWLHLNAGTNGVGSQMVAFSFDQNPGGPRTGTLQFGAQTLTITQAGASYVPVTAYLELFSSTNPRKSSVAVDPGGNLYFTSNYTALSRIDYLTKAVTPVYANANGVFDPGLDAETNIYFFDGYENIFELPSSTSVPLVLQPSPPLNGDLRVAPSGDVFYRSGPSGTNVYLLPMSGTAPTLLFSLDSNSIRDWAVDALDNVYVLYLTNGVGGAVFKWSPANPVLTLLFPSGSFGPLAVDGLGNLYAYAPFEVVKWQAATGATTTIPQNDFFIVDSMAADSLGGVSMFGFDQLTGFYRLRQAVHAWISPRALLEPANAGSDSVAVLPGTTWLAGSLTPVSSAPWLTVTGATNGLVTFSFSTFTGPGNRTAFLTVLGFDIPITQGAPTYRLGANSTVEGPAAGSDSVVLAATPTFAHWTAAANNSWLHLAPAMQSGSGSSTIVFSFDANPGPTRVGSLTLGDQTFSITQAGATYQPVTNLTLVEVTTNSFESLAVDGAQNVFGSLELFLNSSNSLEGYAEWLRASNTVSSFSTASPYFYYPQVTADWVGNVYINNLEAAPYQIQQLDPAGGPPHTLLSTDQYYPFQFAVVPQGNILFIDDSGNLVYYNPVTTQFRILGTGYFNVPAMTIDPAGNLIFANYDLITQSTSILKWNAATEQVSTVLPNVYAYSLAVDAGGNLFLLNQSAQLQELSAATGQLTTLPLPFFPNAMAVDSSGNLYFAAPIDNGTGVYELPRAFVDPTPRLEPVAGGADALPPVVPANEDLSAPFVPTSDQAWLSIGTVNHGAVAFSVLPSATLRAGSVTVLGQRTLVVQGSQLTNYWLGTTNLVDGPAAGADSFVLGTLPGNAPWNAAANVGWLHPPASGNGGGPILFTYDANPGPTRSGAITIAGLTLTVTQAGATYVPVNAPTTLVSSANGFDAPCGVAVDAGGNVYVCDTYNNAVKVWYPTNNQVTVLGSTGFSLPYALAVAPSGNVFIVDTYNNALKEWSPGTSNITTVLNGLSTPFGVAVDAAGAVYVSDTGNGAIKQWLPANNSLATVYSSPGSRPTGVAVDAAGNLYWVEAGTGAVREWSLVNNTVTTLFARQFNEPHGVAVDGRGNVYVADYANPTYVWSAVTHTVSTLSGNTIGVAVDANDNVFIADALDWQVYEIPRAFVDPSPKFEPLAAGQDTLAPVLPQNEDLLPPFAPSSDQPWLSISGVASNSVGFAFSASPNARMGNVIVLGQQIPVVQGSLAPVVTSNPSGGAVYAGKNKQLTVAVFGTPPLVYQWRANGVPIHDSGNVSGSTTATLTLSNLVLANSANYDVVVTNAGGSVTSAVATLTVVPAPAFGSYAAEVLADNPLAYWRLNETNGITAYDYWGGFNGTYAAAAVLDVPGPSNPPFAGFESNNTGVGLVHTNAGAYVSVPFGSLGLSNVSFTAWVYPVGWQDSWAGILMTRNGGSGGAQTGGMGYNDQQMLAETWNDDEPDTWGFVSGLVIPSNTWSLVSIVVSPDRCILYLANTNGVRSATNAVPHNAEVFLNNWRIGNDGLGDPGRTFNGTIDEVAVFPYSLTGAQIQQLFTTAISAAPVILNIQLAGRSVTLSWPTGTLLQANTVAGPYAAVPGNPTSPYIVPAGGPARFFRVQVP